MARVRPLYGFIIIIISMLLPQYIYIYVRTPVCIGQRENQKGEKETVEWENCNRFYADPIQSTFNGLRAGSVGFGHCRSQNVLITIPIHLLYVYIYMYMLTPSFIFTMRLKRSIINIFIL